MVFVCLHASWLLTSARLLYTEQEMVSPAVLEMQLQTVQSFYENTLL